MEKNEWKVERWKKLKKRGNVWRIGVDYWKKEIRKGERVSRDFEGIYRTYEVREMFYYEKWEV